MAITNPKQRNLSESKISGQCLSQASISEQFSHLKNKKQAIIRELHIYGQALNLGEIGKISQHRGFGKWLMKEAEKISIKNKCKKISVISGIGVREYYKKLGYVLEEGYMIKRL